MPMGPERVWATALRLDPPEKKNLCNTRPFGGAHDKWRKSLNFLSFYNLHSDQKIKNITLEQTFLLPNGEIAQQF